MDDALEQIQYSPGNYLDGQSLREAIAEALSNILVCQLERADLAAGVVCVVGSRQARPYGVAS